MRRMFVLLVASLFFGDLAMAYESIYPKTPVGKIEIKQIPARTILAAGGKGDPFQSRNESFGKLFSYIQRNEVAMTVPVEASATTSTMNFLVGRKDAQKDLKPEGNVTVQQLQPITVVSIGMRGSYTQQHYDEGLQTIKHWLTAHPEWQEQGEPYAVYWNSPFVPGLLKTSEVHQPVRSVTHTEDEVGSAPTQQPTQTGKQETSPPKSIYEFTLKDIDGREVKLETYKGKVLLIVNVASRCGFTPQYAGLEKVYEQYRDQGLVVLGFPANNFLWQEPGSNDEIKSFCSARYHVTFPMFSKISVKGKDQHPLYRFLTDKHTDPEFAGEISWNFNKFLVDRAGRIINRFDSRTSPEDEKLIQAIEQALKE